MSESNTPRKRGAPTGNHNAYKHGFYSKRLNSYTEKTLADLNNGSVEEEIQLVRTMIARHLKMRLTNPPASAAESLTDLRVISFAVARVASLMRLAKNLPAEPLDSDDWMEDLLGDALSGLPSDPTDFIQ